MIFRKEICNKFCFKASKTLSWFEKMDFTIKNRPRECDDGEYPLRILKKKIKGQWPLLNLR